MHYGTEMNAVNFGFNGQVQGHGGIAYAGTVTTQYSTSRIELDFLVLLYLLYCIISTILVAIK